MRRSIGCLIGTVLLASCVASDDELGQVRRAERVRAPSRLPTEVSRPDDTFLTYIGPPSYLPKWKTRWEQDLERRAKAARAAGLPEADFYDDYRLKNIKRFFITKPPQTTGFRTPAEYEPSQAYLLNWPLYTQKAWKTLYAEIVKGAWGVVPVLMIYTDAAHRTFIETELKAAGIPASELNDPKKVIWWQHKTNAHWARDYGPISIVTTPSSGQGTLSFVDFRYYYTRYMDDEIPSDLAKDWGINVFRPDLDMEGGNFQTTSDGLCSSTKGTLYYNLQYTQSAIEQIYKDYLNCKQTLFTATMKGGVIAHIDMYSKFGSDTTMMVGQYTTTQSAANSPILDGVAAQFAATKTPSGKTITVTRIPMPDITGILGYNIWRTYTNSLSLSDGTNKVVLIPTYSTQTKYEAAAMAAYATVFPGWKLVKIDSEIIIPGQGAIHCITMQVPFGTKAKMEADPAPLCGAKKFECLTNACGNITAKGCCTPEGILKVCSSKKTISGLDCTGNPKCGWDSAKSLYNCGTSGGADPGGTNPLSCNVITDAGVPDTGAPDQGASNCGSLTVEGCCDNETLWYCLEGTLKYLSCVKNTKCGWDTKESYYNCGTDGKSDPAGKFPKSCGSHYDGGPPQPEAGLPQPCGAVTTAGCCDGDKLKICQSGALSTVDCGKNKYKCGWGTNSYICSNSGAADPSGKNPRDCPKPDLGPPDQALPDKALSPDQAAADAGADGSVDPGDDDDGCSCSTSARGAGGWPLMLALGLILVVGRIRR